MYLVNAFKFDYTEVLKELLPPEIEIPHGYETIG